MPINPKVILSMIPEPKRFSAVASFLIVTALAVALSGCKLWKKEAKKDENEKIEQAVPVEVVTLEKGAIESTLKSSWYLEAEEMVKVLARTSNRVKEILVEEGDEIVKDQVLARLEDHEQRTAVDKAKNQVDKMRAEYNRVKKLFDQSLISEKEFTDAKFEVRQLDLSLDEAQRQLEFTEIKAPISGTVTKRMIRIGDLISNNAELFEIIDFDSLVAFVAVPDKNLAQLGVDQPVRITTTARPGEVFPGYIKRISPIVEARTGMVKVTVGVRKTPLLRPGMYIEAEIVLATKKDALLISRRALVYDGDQLYVYRLKDNRRVERLLLVPRMMDKLNIEPMGGFSVGDQIVIAGHTGLKDNALVRLPGDPDPEKAANGEPVTAEKSDDSGKAGSSAHSS